MNQDTTDEVLLAILRRHLDNQPIGLDDDFYAMGGDSLIALRVVTEANEQGLPIELRDILYHPTARGLLEVLPERPRSGTMAGEPSRCALLDPYDRGMLPAGVTDAWPASALQVGIIYLCEQSRDPQLYHDLIGLEVTGPFDEALFAETLSELCRRHDALRSSFDLGGFSESVQMVWQEVPIPLTVERADTVEAARRWREGELGRLIDWRRAPAFRCHVVATVDTFHITLAIHHAIVDGWSYARLVLELLQIYEGTLLGRPTTLPLPPANGYREFVSLERGASGHTESSDFWQAVADSPPMLFDRGRFSSAGDPSELVSFPIDASTLRGLQTAAQRIGVPLKSLVLGCHARALGRWTGRDRDVVTGLTLNGRPEIAGADLLVGLFLNTVPMRLSSVSGDHASVARMALAEEQRALPHRRYPLAQIEQRLGRPAFDVSFNFTHFHAYRELQRLDALQVTSWWTFDKASIPMMVDFMIESRGAGTGIEVAYDPCFLSKEAVEEYAHLYREELLSAVEDSV